MELVKSKNFEYTEEERKKGKLIAQNINKIYAESDNQVAKSNFITRIICAIESFYYT